MLAEARGFSLLARIFPLFFFLPREIGSENAKERKRKKGEKEYRKKGERVNFIWEQ